MTNFTCSDEQYHGGLMDTICNLNATVAFKSKYLLWISGVGSITSMTLAQLKSHNVQHEFCTTWQMKAAYSCAALMNTASYICLLVSCFTSTVDFNNLNMDRLDAQGSSKRVLSNYRLAIVIVCLLIIFFTSLLARYLVFKNNVGSAYTLNLSKKSNCTCPCTCNNTSGQWVKIIMKSVLKFWKNLTNFVKNTLKYFNLPTSQYCYNEHYFCYQSMDNVDIKFFMVQSLLYIFFMTYNTILIVINSVIIFNKQIDQTFPPILAPSQVSSSRRNFAIVSSLIIPLGWALSYLFLWIYFKLDKGFFSGTNMRFKYANYKPPQRICGAWKDLNELYTDTEDIELDTFSE